MVHIDSTHSSSNPPVFKPWQKQSTGDWYVQSKGRRYRLAPTEHEAVERATRYSVQLKAGLQIPKYGTDTAANQAGPVLLESVGSINSDEHLER